MLYSNGELSITQKLGLITCIPKGDKHKRLSLFFYLTGGLSHS